jgi:hypothetical protein
MMNANEMVWDSVDKIEQARMALSAARTTLVLAGLGEHSVRFQKQLAKIDAQLVIIGNRAVKQVGVRIRKSEVSA